VKLGLIPNSNSTQLGLDGALLQLTDITNQSLVITLTDLNLKFALTSLVACTSYDLSDGCRNGTLLASSLLREDNAFITKKTPASGGNQPTSGSRQTTCFLPIIIVNFFSFLYLLVLKT